MVWTMAAKRFTVTLEHEYVEWIEEAKRPEPRACRIAGTLERVNKGETAR